MSLSEVLVELQKKYLESFAEKTSRIETLWKDQRNEELRVEFHKLKGSGKTYGLPEVSVLGAVMEKLCERGSQESINQMIPLAVRLLHAIGDYRRANKEALQLESSIDFKEIERAAKSIA